VAHPACQLLDDPQVVACLSRRLFRLADPLHAPLGVRDRALALGPRRRGGQHDVRELGGLGQEQILDDEERQPLEDVDHPVLIGLGLCRVLADHVEHVLVAARHRVALRR
jgi:hypothetical protein